jgi:hypothetical protein
MFSSREGETATKFPGRTSWAAGERTLIGSEHPAEGRREPPINPAKSTTRHEFTAGKSTSRRQASVGSAMPVAPLTRHRGVGDDSTRHSKKGDCRPWHRGMRRDGLAASNIDCVHAQMLPTPSTED